MNRSVMGYDDPLELFRVAVERLNKENWAGLAALCDPVSLSAFKRHLVDTLFHPREPARALTATELMKAVPNMPRAVAEYQVAQFRKSMDPKMRLHDELPSVPSRDALERMTPAEVFAAWLDGKSLRRQIDRDVEHRRMPRATANEILADAVHRPFNFRALGFVPDGDRVGYVAYRREAIDEPPTSGDLPDELQLARDLYGRGHVLFVMVRQQSDGWLLVADSDFLLVGQMQVVFGGE